MIRIKLMFIVFAPQALTESLYWLLIRVGLMKSPAGLWLYFQCLCVISMLPPACPPPAHRVQPACRREDDFKHPPPLKIKSGLSHTHAHTPEIRKRVTWCQTDWRLKSCTFIKVWWNLNRSYSKLVLWDKPYIRYGRKSHPVYSQNLNNQLLMAGFQK